MAIAAANASKGRIASGVTNAVTTTSVTTSASGSTFVVGLQYEGGATFTSIVDSKSNTYTLIGTETTANSGAKCRFYYCQNGTGGASHTVTVTVNSNVAITAHFLEITGGKTASILNPTPPAANDDVSSPFTSNSITTAQADAMLVSFFGGTNSGSNPATNTESTGFTVQSGSDETVASQYWTGCLATKILTSTATTNSSFTESGATTGLVWIAAFEAAAGGGGGSSGPIEGFVERDINRLPGYYEPEFKKKAWAARNFLRIAQPINVSIAETVTATDTQSSAAIFASAVAESGSASSTQSSAAVFGAAVAETATAVDTVSSVAVLAAAVSESGSATATQSSAAIFASAVTETASATDTRSSAAVFGVSVSETATATDSQSSSQTMAATVAEAATATDTTTGGIAGSPDVTVTESASAASTQSAVLVIGVSEAETAAATDSQSVVLALAGAVAESVSATATQSATQIINVTVAETATALDTASTSQTMFSALLETANAIDVSGASMPGDVVSAVAESAYAIDTCDAQMSVRPGSFTSNRYRNPTSRRPRNVSI